MVKVLTYVFLFIFPFCFRFFNQGSIDESNYISENSNSFYGIVTYQAADCLPYLSSDTFGPFTSPSKVLSAIERLEYVHKLSKSS